MRHEGAMDGRTMAVLGVGLALVTGLLGLSPAPAEAGVGVIIPVTTTTDETVGTNNGNCSIREAFASANTDDPVDACVEGIGEDTIELADSANYLLTFANAAPLTLTEATTINGNNAQIQQEFSDRVLTLQSDPYFVFINDLSLRGSNSACTCNGGVIHVGADVGLNLTRSRLSLGSAGNANGGAIYNNNGSVNISDSTIGNDNSAGLAGGNIYNNGGDVSITRSLVWDGLAGTKGGGIYNDAGSLVILNSTVSGNAAGDDGGGIYNTGVNGSTILTYLTTITDNRADYSGSGVPAGGGGGIFHAGSGANGQSVDMQGTILAGNIDETGADLTPAPDCVGPIDSDAYNIVGVVNGCSVDVETGDHQGNLNNPVDPGLNGLSIVPGQPTQAHTPQSGSLAVNNNPPCNGPDADPAEDQRLVARPQGTNCDIGAVERDLTPPTTPTMQKPSKKFFLGKKYLMDWTAASDLGGIGNIVYDPVRLRAKYNAPFDDFPILGGGFETKREVRGKPGFTDCYAVTSRDADGNESPESNYKCSAKPLDDRALKMSNDDWKKRKGPAYYKSTFLLTKKEDSTLTLNGVQNATQLALVATRCPGCGKVRVTMDGDLVKEVSLAGPQKNKKLYKLPAFPLASGTVKIKVLSDGKEVKIDGLGVLRALTA